MVLFYDNAVIVVVVGLAFDWSFNVLMTILMAANKSVLHFE